VSFESVNFAGRYVRHVSGSLLHVQAVSDAAGHADATFHLE
jgi:hypothetical protein